MPSPHQEQRRGDGNASDTPTPVEILSREDRIKLFGLDCGDSLEWHNWTPGGEYVKKLLVKNVTTQTLKLKYKLPMTKYFGMDFPETIILSAGTSRYIKVTFRPIERAPYEDVIPITTNGGTFFVPIRATLPFLRVTVTEQINFGCCAVKEPATQQLHVSNTGEVGFDFIVSIEEPFSVTPASGTLQPQESTVLTVTFIAPSAAPFAAKAIISAGDSSLPVYVSGVGKYACVSVEPMLDFGFVLVDHISEKTTLLRNCSNVKCSFKIHRVESDCDPRFNFSVMSGVLEPTEELPIKVVYSAVASGTYSCDTYEVSVRGGNTAIIRCSGKADGPRLSLSPASINFGSVEIGSDITFRVLNLINHTNEPSPFQFYVPSDGVFIIEPSQGIVPGKSNCNISVGFSGMEPIVYYRRVVCLVRTEILFFDILAVAYDHQRRPPPITQKHINSYYTRREIGDGSILLPPEALELTDQKRIVESPLLTSFDLFQYFFHQTTHFTQVPPNPFTDDNKSDYEFGMFGIKEVEILEDFIDFGACSRQSHSTRSFHVINRTKGKVTCVFTSNKSDAVFTVEPQIADVDPHAIATFQVTFRPISDNQFYGGTLSCYTYYKTMRNFRLVTEKSIVPTWWITSSVAGHTFEGGRETFLPRIDIGNRRINFPPCHFGSASYQITWMVNSGDTALAYKFIFQSTLFSCQPSQGILQSGASQLVVFRFLPNSPGSSNYRQIVQCVLNGSISNAISIALIASSSTPAIQLENNAELYFPPTCLGAPTSRSYKIHNPVRVNVVFRWEIPPEFSRNLQIEPNEGILKGNESLDITCTFAPSKPKVYQIKTICRVSSEGSSVPPNQVALTAIGKGEIGKVIITPKILDFGNILIGDLSQRHITLKNPSGCNVQYILEWQAKDGAIDESYSTYADLTDPQDLLDTPRSRSPVLEIIPAMGTIPAYSTDMSGPDSKSEIIACGVYPLLSISDIRSDHLDRVALWRRFDVSNLNLELASNLSPYERILNDGNTLVSIEEASLKIANFIFDFGGATIGSGGTRVLVQFTNTGPLETPWRFSFKDELDGYSKKEAWVTLADSISEKGKREEKLLESKMFRIRPRNGVLKPGETTIVEFIYLHTHNTVGLSPGLDELSVLLSIFGGKQAIIILRGWTLGSSEPYLHFHSTTHIFNPLPLGLSQPPIQSYTLYNDGPVDVFFEFDTVPLEILRKDNYDFDIFECLTPSGVIPAGSQFTTQWRFTPLEDKEYICQIPISIKGGPTTLLKFQGQGYHPHHTHLPSAYTLTVEEENTPPPKPHLSLPGQLATLSLESISLGAVAVYSTTRRVIVLTNMTKMPVTFHWENTGPFTQYARVIPQYGVLAPYQARPLRLEQGNKYTTEVFVAHGQNLSKGILPPISPRITQSLVTTGSSNVSVSPTHTPRSHTLASFPHNSLFLVIHAQSMLPTDYYRFTENSVAYYGNGDLDTLKLHPLPPLTLTSEEKNVSETVVGEIISEVIRESDLTELANLETDQEMPYFIQLLENEESTVESETEGETQTQSDEFKSAAEHILENTIFNLITEAIRNEFAIEEMPPVVLPRDLLTKENPVA